MDVNNEYGCLAIQTELLTLLKTFHDLCVKNDVKYSLIGGSLLGAIRDGGFIPWDDDADIMISRNEFNKLISIIENSKEIVVKRVLWIYRIQLSDTNVKSKNGYNPTIDLFIVDNMPDGNITRKLNYYLISIGQGLQIQRSHKSSLQKFSFLSRIPVFITSVLGRFLSTTTKLKLFDYLAQRFNNGETEKKAIFYAPNYQIRFLYPKDMMDNIVLKRFEDIELYITTGFDEVLTMTYGDYMTPPKLKDRKPIHS